MKIKLDQPLLDVLKFCQACGKCAAVCPVFHATGRESLGPRGKIAILRAYASGKLKEKDLTEVFGACVQCGKCAEACPAKLPLEDVFSHAASCLAKYGKTGLARRAAMTLGCSHPAILDRLQAPLSMLQRNLDWLPGGKALKGFAEALPELGAGIGKIRPAQASGAKVLIFPGCVARWSRPEIVEASAQTLGLLGFEIDVSRKLVCCGGRPGKLADSRRLVERNLKELRGIEFDHLVTLCPECLKSIKKRWITLDPDDTFASGVASRASDILTFIASIKDVEKLPPQPKRRAFWHKPCSIAHEDSEQARIFLGLELENDDCCGGGLGFLGRPPAQGGLEAIASTLSSRARSRLAARGCDLVVTSCPACLQSLQKAFKDRNEKTEALHGVQFFRDALLKGREND